MNKLLSIKSARYYYMKSQSSLERMLIISVVIIVATMSLIFIYYGFHQIVKSQNINYISNIYFSNIYYVNNTMLITTKNNASIGNDVSAYLNVTFINGTKSTYDIEYKLTSAYATQDNEKIYEFNTHSFILNLKNTTYLKIGLVFVKTNGISLQPDYNSTNRVTYYPLNAFSNLEAYTLNVTTSGGGIVSPNTTQYYYSGTKVVLNATPLENYSFVGWDGYGIGNYTGPNSTDVIKIGSGQRSIHFRVRPKLNNLSKRLRLFRASLFRLTEEAFCLFLSCQKHPLLFLLFCWQLKSYMALSRALQVFLLKDSHNKFYLKQKIQ